MEYHILIIVASVTVGMLTTLYFMIKYSGLTLRSWINPLKVKSLIRLLKTVFLTIVSVASMYAAAMLVLIILRIRLMEPYYSILTSVMAGLLLAGMGFIIGTLLVVGIGRVLAYLVRRLMTFNYVRMDVSKDIMTIRNNIHELTLMLRKRIKHHQQYDEVGDEN